MFTLFRFFLIASIFIAFSISINNYKFDNKWFEKNINHTPWNNKTNVELYPGYKITDLRKTFDDFWINIINNNKFYYCKK